MGSGIAAQIAKQIPEAAAVDTRTYNRLGVKLGSFSHVHLDDYTVVNLYGQSIKELSSAGIPTDYNAVVKS
ncbi:MAG: macro domain-containing protein, partial [Phycisphaerales bacterium]